MKTQSLILTLFFCRILSANTTFFATFNGTGTSTSWGFNIAGVTGTLSVTPGSEEQGAPINGPIDPTGGTNFPGGFFTPAPPSNLDWLELLVNGVNNGANDVIDMFTLTFSAPVSNPVFQFENLDASQEIFTGARDASGNPISGATLASSFSLLSGNNLFTTAVNGSGNYVVHPNAVTADNPGCESNSAGNPIGACGSVLLTGSYSSITWNATDVNPSAASGDGWNLQLSTTTPEPGTFGLLVGSLGLLGLGAFRRRLR